jgi:hypothetical protein
VWKLDPRDRHPAACRIMLQIALAFFLGVGCGIGLCLIASSGRKAPSGDHDGL